MEGKELHNQDDDELNKGSKKKSEEDSDDFGLPDASYESESAESENFDQGENIEDTDSASGYGTAEEYEEPAKSYTYGQGNDYEKKSPTGLIIFLSLLGIAIIAVAVYWFFFRTPDKEKNMMPVTENIIEKPDTTNIQPIIEEPKVETPVKREPATPQEASYQTINARTGRYYIVLNSFFDEDLAEDYSKKLAKGGVSTIILKPDDRKKFKHVVTNEDFSTFGDAAVRLENLKTTYGDNIWVMKF